MAYRKETDYMALMNKAALSGDLDKAAEYERQRNEKIDGEGLSYHKTYVYNQAPPGQTALKATEANREDNKTSKIDTDISKYTKKKDKALNKVLSSEFSYDVEKDPVYKQYKKAYTRAARLTGEDVLGKVSENTGGLSSSYAVTAAMQAENAQMDKLADKIPELYTLAYNQYLKDIDTKIKQYELLQKADDTQYARSMEAKKRADTQRENDRAFALSAGKAAWDQMLSEAELTGVYKNQPTLAAQQYMDKHLLDRDKLMLDQDRLMLDRDRLTLDQDELMLEKEEMLKDSVWRAIENGVYDPSFAEILGLDASVLEVMATVRDAQAREKETEGLKEIAWMGIENGVYEDWFADVLPISAENLMAMAKYYEDMKTLRLETEKPVEKTVTYKNTGSNKKTTSKSATYGEIMLAMMQSDDPYAVFMEYAPSLGRTDYDKLYEAMLEIKASKKTKNPDTQNENPYGPSSDVFFPFEFGEEPTLDLPDIDRVSVSSDQEDKKKKTSHVSPSFSSLVF